MLIEELQKCVGRIQLGAITFFEKKMYMSFGTFVPKFILENV